MKLKYNFTIKQVLDEYYAVSAGPESAKFPGVLRFNETGIRIFELIQEGNEENEILSILKQEYDASDESLDAEIRKIVDKLSAEDILVK